MSKTNLPELYLFQKISDPITQKTHYKPLSKGLIMRPTADGEFLPYHVEQFRLVHSLNGSALPAATLGDQASFVLPHLADLNLLLNFAPEDWASLAGELAKELDPVNLEKVHIGKQDLLEPTAGIKSTQPSDEQQAYQQFYQQMADNQQLVGFCLPAQPLAFLHSSFQFGANDLIGEIWPCLLPYEDAQKHEAVFKTIPLDSNDFGTTLLVTESTDVKCRLLSGSYFLRISFDTNKDFWSDHKHLFLQSQQPEGEFLLKLDLDFDFDTPLGKFALASIDPISLEEQIIQQYPDLYADLAQADAFERVNVAEVAKAKEALTLLQHYKKQVGLAKAINDHSLGYLRLSSEQDLAWKIFGAASGKIGSISPEMKSVFDGIFTAKSLADALQQRDDFGAWLKKLKANPIDFSKTSANIREQLQALDGAPPPPLLAKWAPESLVKLAESKRGAWDIGDVLNSADILGKWLSAAHAGKQLRDTKESRQQVLQQYQQRAQLYFEQTTRPVDDPQAPIQSQPQEHELDVSAFDQLLDYQLARRVNTLNYLFEHDEDYLRVGSAQAQQLSRDISLIAKTFTPEDFNLVRIRGYASTPGGALYNMDLSQRRAQYIFKQYQRGFELAGIAQDSVMMDIVPLGEVDQFDHEAEDAPYLIGRQRQEARERQNRRVQVDILLKERKGRLSFVPHRNEQKALTALGGATVAAEAKVVEDWVELMSSVGKAVFDTTLLLASALPGIGSGAWIVRAALIKKAADHVKNIKEGAEAVIGLGTQLGELALQQHYLQGQRQHSVLNTLTKQSLANQTLLLQDVRAYKAAVDQDDAEAVTSSFVRIQHRMRFEVLNGLVSLLKFCATSGSTNFKKNLEAYRVQEYVDQLVLNDGWHWHLHGWSGEGMDQMWLQTLAEQAANQKSQGFRGFIDKWSGFLQARGRQARLDAHALLRVSAQMSYQQAFNEGDHSILMAQMQRLFPTQMRLSVDMDDFSELFARDFSALNTYSVYYMGVYYRDRGSVSVNDWRPIAVRDPSEPLSPLTEIRLIVALNQHEVYAVINEEQIELRTRKDSQGQDIPLKLDFVPYSIRQRCYNGFNVDGPEYQGLLKPLTEADLIPAEKRDMPELVGALGVVIEPSFSLGLHQFKGTRPLKVTQLMNDHEDLNLSDVMHMGWVFSMGNKDKLITRSMPAWLSSNPFLARPPFDHCQRTLWPHEYKVQIDSERVHTVPSATQILADGSVKVISTRSIKDEELLLDSDHWVDGKDAEVKPKLFDADVSLTTRVRLNKQGHLLEPQAMSHLSQYHYPQVFLNAPGPGTLLLANFDWKTPVELYTFVACEKLKTEAYELKDEQGNLVQRTWKSVSMSFELEECSQISSFKGPTVHSHLVYVGHISRQRGQALAVLIDPEFSDLAAHQKSPFHAVLQTAQSAQTGDAQAQDTLLAWSHQDGLLDSWFGEKKHLFVSVHGFSYQAPTGEKIQSLRPFGERVRRVALESPVMAEHFSWQGRVNINEALLAEDDAHCFQFAFRKFKTEGRTGVDIDKPDGVRSVFIAAPATYFDPMPWYVLPAEKVEQAKKLNTANDQLQKMIETKGSQVQQVFDIQNKPEEVQQTVTINTKYRPDLPMYWQRWSEEEKRRRIKQWIEKEGKDWQGTGQVIPLLADVE